MTRRLVPALLTGGFLAGCIFGGGSGGGQAPDPDEQQRTTGVFCLHADDSAVLQQSFVADQPVTIRFRVNDCLSSSCTEAEQASCTVAPNLRVAAEASWLDLSRTNTACTDDCGRLEALCTSTPLAAGTHTFLFRTKTLTLEIPSTHAEPPCVDTDAP